MYHKFRMITFIVLGTILVPLGLAMLFFQGLPTYNLSKNGVQTEAQVVAVDEDREQRRSRRRSRTVTVCDILYSYEVNGQTYRNEYEADGGCAVTAGRTILVRYDPKDPSRSIAANEDSSGGLFVSGIMIVGGLGLLGAGIYQRRRG